MLQQTVENSLWNANCALHCNEGSGDSEEIHTHIQGVPGGMCQTSGECSLC